MVLTRSTGHQFALRFRWTPAASQHSMLSEGAISRHRCRRSAKSAHVWSRFCLCEASEELRRKRK
eukprot:scaffold6997_cov134-Pinguiococcus_pyrenoidosus.AAC.1